MNFQDYLEKYGLTVKELAEMDSYDREWAAKTTYEAWARREDLWASGTDFLNGWRLAESVMVFMHMAQQARELAEGKPQ